MKKRLSRWIVILPVVMALTVTTAMSVYAFSDVKAGSWYYEYVNFLEENKISTGYPDGTFRPNNSITNAESLVLIMKTLDIPTDSVPQTTEYHWAFSFIQPAKRMGAIDEDFRPDEPIKRGEAAEMVFALMQITADSKGASPFSDINSPVLKELYNLGIFSGFSENGALLFKPDNNLTRAELSVIIKKLDDYKKKVSGEFILSPILKDGEAAIVENPDSIEDFEKIFLYMAKNNIYEMEISYASDYKDRIKDGTLKDMAADAFENTFNEYPEYCCYTDGLYIGGSYGTYSNKLTLEVESSNFSNSEITKMRTAFIEETQEIVKNLIDNDKITTDMSQKDIARVLYQWTAVNLKYDQSSSQVRFTGYGASHYRTAVCQGYTAFYNAMCKMAGIEVQGITGTAKGSNSPPEGHMWTIAVLDGERVHIDVTFGDPVPDVSGRCNFDYFAVDSQFMKKTHTWDKAKYDI